MVTVCWKKYCTTPACKQICVNYIFIRHAMPCNVTSTCHAKSSWHVISHHIIPCHAKLCHYTMPRHVFRWCHAMPCHVIPCMQCHAMSSYPVMQLFISHNPTSNLCALIGQNTSCGTCTISLISHNLKIQYDGVFTRPILPHEGVCLQINFYLFLKHHICLHWQILPEIQATDLQKHTTFKFGRRQKALIT